MATGNVFFGFEIENAPNAEELTGAERELVKQHVKCQMLEVLDPGQDRFRWVNLTDIPGNPSSFEGYLNDKLGEISNLGVSLTPERAAHDMYCYPGKDQICYSFFSLKVGSTGNNWAANVSLGGGKSVDVEVKIVVSYLQSNVFDTCNS